jgi:hypothetical protein
MPIEHLYIARVIDGLILVRFCSRYDLVLNSIRVTRIFAIHLQVASMDHGAGAGAQNTQQMDVYKSQVGFKPLFWFVCSMLSSHSILAGEAAAEEVKPQVHGQNEHRFQPIQIPVRRHLNYG